MLETIGLYAMLCFAMLFVGFSTTKLTIYGGLTTGALWVSYGVYPSLSASTVTDTMFPQFVSLWSFYPTVIADMTAEGLAVHGPLGGIIYFLLVTMPVIPYISGIVFGFFAWPELIILRILF